MSNDLNSKRMYLIRILQILEKYSSAEHPILYTQIVKILKNDYDIDIERKAVGRAIIDLEIMFGAKSDIKIERVHRKGIYLKRLFSDAELKLLIDSVLASRHIPQEETEDIIRRLNSIAQNGFYPKVKYYKVANKDQAKVENHQLFTNIDKISEAIQTSKKIKFTYNRYGEDLKLHPYDNSTYTVSPFHTLLHNQHYFLISYDENIKDQRNFRVDKITDIEILKDTAASIDVIQGADYKKWSTAYPYMFTDKPKKIKFITTVGMIGEIIDWFGKEIKLKKVAEKKYEVTLTASADAMKFWALHYTPDVEIISPPELRESVKKELEEALKYYQ